MRQTAHLETGNCSRENGAIYGEAAAKHCITRSTSHSHATSPPRGSFQNIAFTNEEEEIIINLLRNFSIRGVPLTQRHLQEAVKILVNSIEPTRRYMLPFCNGTPGRAFLRAFRRRHREQLSVSKPLRQEAVRFAQVNSEVLSTHFVTLEKLICENDHHESTDTEADQSAMDGAEPSANRQDISDIPDGPEPSRTFSRMRKKRSVHYAFAKINELDA